MMQLFSRGRNHLKAAISLFLLRLGGENHLKAAIALLVNKQSATFSLREKSGFSPPPPQLSLARALQKYP